MPVPDLAPDRSTATHPVIAGFHPDPSVCRVGEDHYLACSSFELSPGVPIWHSRDLVRWTLVGHALTRDDQFRAGSAGDNLGVYAPTLRHHDGRFWLVTSDVAGAPGQLLVTADDPRGEWSSPVRFPELSGIDPDLAWDEQGQALMTYSGTHEGASAIMQAEVDLATGSILEEPRPLWSGTGLAHPEAPHLYRHDGWWYLLIAEGGTERGHTVAVARSRDARGPYEGAGHNPILTHRSTTHPVQNTGHGDLVQRADGTWAMVHLGARPRGGTPGFHVNGRETFLAGVHWRDGWPHVVELDRAAPGPVWFDDDLSRWPLDLRWVSPGLRAQDFVRPADGGGVRLRPAVAPSGTVSMLAARCTEERWCAVADVEPGHGRGALRVRLDERHWVEVRAGADGVAGVVCIGGIEHVLANARPTGARSVTLEVCAVDSLTGGPDDLQLRARGEGVECDLGRIDGRYLSTEVAGGFTGRLWGVRAVDGTVVVRRMAVADVETSGHRHASSRHMVPTKTLSG